MYNKYWKFHLIMIDECKPQTNIHEAIPEISEPSSLLWGLFIRCCTETMSRNILFKKKKWKEWKLNKRKSINNTQLGNQNPNCPTAFGMDVAPRTVSSFHSQKQRVGLEGLGKAAAQSLNIHLPSLGPEVTSRAHRHWWGWSYSTSSLPYSLA